MSKELVQIKTYHDPWDETMLNNAIPCHNANTDKQKRIGKSLTLNSAC